MKKQIVAIDVSKLTLDICIKPSGSTFKITNDLAGFKELKSVIDPTLETLVVMEHTGQYSFRLEKFLQDNGMDYCKLAALEIKRSIGMVRGKTDRIDAVRIADYAWLRKDWLNACTVVDDNLVKLNQLLSLRAKLVKDCGGYKARLKEMIASGSCVKGDLIYKTQNAVLKVLNVEVKKLEAGIEQLITANPELKKNFDLVRTIKGVGRVVAARMLTITGNFKRFKDARKFNCYAGLAPFKHESGTSIRSRSRVSHLANKEMKTLLSLAAFCAIRCNDELKQYYQKRLAEGKRKMSCLNIIRAKIVSRMFAVIKRQGPYEIRCIAA